MVKLGKKLLLSLQKLPKYVFHKLLRPKRKCFYLTFLVVFLIEVLAYYYTAFLWYPIRCNDSKRCTRILLVADPQLIGLRNEHLHYLTPLAIWDSDRFLSKTYDHAYSFTQPDVIIFLGDLLDEGSTAKDKDFQYYVDRVYSIFKKDVAQHIWLPGDNDIGGEYADYITAHKIERFNKAFPQENVVIHKNIRFNIINKLTNNAPQTNPQRNYTDIALSHLNLLSVPTVFVDKKVIDALQPKIIFSAHTHKASIIKMSQDSRNIQFTSHIGPDNTEVFEYDLNDDNVIEMVVPTCSYRMGTDKIGYGFAVLESNTLKYTILWTSSRFLYLEIYGVFCSILIFYYLFSFCCSCKKAETAQYSVLEHIA